MSIHNRLRFSLGIFFIVASLLLTKNYSKNAVSVSLTKLTVRNIFDTDDKILAELTPTVTPFPSVTPTPTPTSLPGYCLFVPILEYHHIQPTSIAVARGQTGLSVDPSYFDQQMAYIVSHGYTTITAEQLVHALLSHTPLPPKSILVTLDDGYLDNFTNAYPIAQKYHIILNLMIPTGLLGGVGNNDYLTWQQLKQMVTSGQVYVTDHTWSHYPLGSGTIDKDQFEIMTAKKQLETNLNMSINLLTYPYGAGAHNRRVIAELQQDGFIGAFADTGGMYQCDTSIYALTRTHIGNAPLSAYGL